MVSLSTDYLQDFRPWSFIGKTLACTNWIAGYMQRATHNTHAQTYTQTDTHKHTHRYVQTEAELCMHYS